MGQGRTSDQSRDPTVARAAYPRSKAAISESAERLTRGDEDWQVCFSCAGVVVARDDEHQFDQPTAGSTHATKRTSIVQQHSSSYAAERPSKTFAPSSTTPHPHNKAHRAGRHSVHSHPHGLVHKAGTTTATPPQAPTPSSASSEVRDSPSPTQASYSTRRQPPGPVSGNVHQRLQAHDDGMGQCSGMSPDRKVETRYPH
jgi:hypothetical protein